MKTSPVCCAISTRGTSMAGFSLVELLTVLGIISVLAAVTIPAISALNSAGGFSQAASDIPGTLEQARAYAMGNNTYVFVGIQEVDGLTPTSTDGTGRIAVVVLASLDGTRPYGTTPGALTTNVTTINKPLVFSNAHLISSASLATTGTMVRPTAATDLSSTPTKTTFQWPITGTAKYKFTKVIEFDPQGTARVETTTTYNSAIPSYIEIPLVPIHGNSLPSTTPSNQAAIQIQGITGEVRTYRP